MSSFCNIRRASRILRRLPGASLVLLLLLATGTAYAKGTLSADRRIDSEILGYAVQYRVYLPGTADDASRLPAIYMLDGQWYLEYGEMVEVLDREIEQGNIEPVAAVFVDSRNPDDLSENRRNEQFMCNRKYLGFFVNELLADVSATFPVSDDARERVIAGLSFGGLNAACFGIMAADFFGGIGMQSPASAKHLKIIARLYDDEPVTPVRVFLSVGTRRDNTKATRKFHRVLQSKGYDVQYVEVPFTHEWANWQPLIDDLLATFFAPE
ncbi:MAG: esterase family protein [Woeseiaceae bacterium]|nr:esterase family protein [Woeseiaceae bacterium]